MARAANELAHLHRHSEEPNVSSSNYTYNIFNVMHTGQSHFSLFFLPAPIRMGRDSYCPIKWKYWKKL